MRSAYVILVLAVVLTFIIVWRNFKVDVSETEAFPHLSTLIEKESCKYEACSISIEDEYYDLVHIASEELEGAFLLEFLFTVKPQQLNTKFFLTIEYRNADDQVVKMHETEVVAIKGGSDIFIEFVLDIGALEKSEKIVAYIRNPERKSFLIEALRLIVKENNVVDYLAELDLIKSNSVLFPENQDRKFVDILFLENNEKYKSVNTCKVKVFNNIKYSGKVKTFLVLESSNKEGEIITYESKEVASSVISNDFLISDLSKYNKNNSVLKVYLYSAGKYIPNSIQEVKLSFYK